MSSTATVAMFPVRISAIRQEVADINVYDMVADSGEPLPMAPPGAHIDVELPVGKRQYSLLLDGGSGPPLAYRIAVKKELGGRGGSRYMHESLRVGDKLSISAPRNHFPLVEGSGEVVLIAGGIGITPILSMMNRLRSIAAPWRLVYAARSREHMAFVKEFEGHPQVRLHFDSEAKAPLDVSAVLRGVAPGTHFYCCGPVPMLEAFEKAAASLPDEVKHVEYFHNKEAPALEGGFTVTLARSNLELFVPQGKSILEIVQAAGVDVEYSCAEGTCGSCQTKVIAGIPDHRDIFLPANRKKANTVMMICCSGCKTDRLVLDL
jgi:ferredoxin-NADP reductase